MPILDLLSHGFFLGSAQFLIPAIALHIPLTQVFLIAAASIYAQSIIGDIHNEIVDYKVDRETNIQNTASIIDFRKYERLIYLLPVLTIVTLVYTTSTNLTGDLRTKTILALGVVIFIYILLPFRLRKKIIDHSQLVHILGSIIILALIKLGSAW